MSAVTGFIAGAALAFTPIDVEGLFIDGFAGGGGASTGIAQAIGRDPDIAVNHSETALAIHKANHPGTEHHCTDIRMPFLPKQTTRGRPVAGAWFSPDCKEFSKAKGGPVKDRSIRALCWEVIAWLKDARPTCGYLENVEEFEYAAPLDDDGYPIKGQEGREFKRFVKAIRALGYRVQWKILVACNYGAPTSRKRLYMVMRCDGKPIVWPKPTHGAPDSPGVRSGKLIPYRTAAECIDWSIPCPSIFERKRELADATKRRIAHGVMRYVVNAAKPFIVSVAHGDSGGRREYDSAEPLGTVAAGGNAHAAVDVEVAPVVTYGQHGGQNRRADQPHHTVAASKKDTNGVIAATLASLAHGERRPGERPRSAALDEPVTTTHAGGGNHAVVGATLVGVGGRRGQSAPMPVAGTYPTTTTKGDSAIACATMVKMGNGERDGQAPRALDIGKPYGTATAKGSQAAAVTAFLSSFYGSDKKAAGGDPAQPTRTARAGGQHHAVVTAHIEQANGGPRNKNSAGHDARKPLSTTMTTGSQQRVVETTMIAADDLPPGMAERAQIVAAFLIKYYGNEGDGHGLNGPIHTVTTKDRFAVVTVTIDAKTYVIVDIGLRMLKPRELANAQGFPPDYKLNPVVRKYLRGKWVERELTIAEQISAIGNSVCPPVARALVLANQPRREKLSLAA